MLVEESIDLLVFIRNSLKTESNSNAIGRRGAPEVMENSGRHINYQI